MGHQDLWSNLYKRNNLALGLRLFLTTKLVSRYLKGLMSAVCQYQYWRATGMHARHNGGTRATPDSAVWKAFNILTDLSLSPANKPSMTLNLAGKHAGDEW
jgi:hypothetical protein